LRNSHLLKDPAFPTALNAHRGRDLVWDPAEVVAHRDGRPLPQRAEPSPDDLLDEVEAAAAVGVSAETFTDQVGRLKISVRHINVHGLRYFRRGDLVSRHANPPGRPGKPVGAKDLTPRKKRGAPTPVAERAASRINALATYLADVAQSGTTRPSVTELAARFNVSGRTIERWLARINETS
jgi:hypothetical protein